MSSDTNTTSGSAGTTTAGAILGVTGAAGSSIDVAAGSTIGGGKICSVTGVLAGITGVGVASGGFGASVDTVDTSDLRTGDGTSSGWASI